MIRRLLRGSGWRREVLRANLWLVPAVEVVVAVVLFATTYALDRAAFAGDFGLPGACPDICGLVTWLAARFAAGR